MKKGVLTLLMTLCLGIFAGFAQMVDPTNWSTSQRKTGDNEYELIFKTTLTPGWHIYSVNTPEGGPMKTSLSILELGKGVQLVGDPVENEPIKKYSDVFKVEEWYFENEYTLTQKIKVTDSGISEIHAEISCQVCEESCVNLEKDFTIKLEGREDVSVKVASTTAETETPEGETGEKKDNLWIFFWLSFGSGLLAVVMPCIFPMIPMTVSFFMHGDSNKAKARSKAVFFGLSIIAIYTTLGLIISFLLGPGFINWLSTHWLPNTAFFLIFVIFAASFFGAFEIVLPSSLVNKTDKQADKGGYIGAFFMAFTLVLVSFSCTAPIVGSVLVEASRGSVLRPIVGMLGFSIAVALPFAFFAFFPSKLSSLPKSGGWLNTVKVVLGFVELALGLKFLMVVDQTYHLGLLDREVYIAIWITIFVLMGIYLMGKMKFKHDSDLPYIGVGRLTMIIITFSFVFYLIPGMFGAPLKMLSGFLPPQESIDFDLNRIIRENARDIMESGVRVGETTVSKTPESFDEPVKYSSEGLKLPHGLHGYFEYEQALKAAQALDKPLFIDFTGKACVNCRDMEQRVWSDPRILKILREEYVVVALYVDIRTKLPEEDQYIGKDGKKKNTLGKKNTDFQVSKFDYNAQPYYVLLDSRGGNDEDLKPHILVTPRGADYDKEAFLEFLKQGVQEYKKRAR